MLHLTNIRGKRRRFCAINRSGQRIPAFASIVYTMMQQSTTATTVYNIILRYCFGDSGKKGHFEGEVYKLSKVSSKESRQILPLLAVAGNDELLHYTGEAETFVCT